jgi:hypothetical protein
VAYVYIHKKRTTGDIFYVGIGSDTKYKRANFSYQRNKLWISIYKKHGIVVEILHDNITRETACQIEIDLIKLYGRKFNKSGILANITEGGEGNLGLTHSEETRQIISKTHKGKRLTPEQRATAIQTLRNRKGTKNKNPRSLEYLEKQKVAQTGKKRPKTIEWAENQSKVMRGKNNGKYKGLVEAYKDGFLVGVYNGTGDCARELNLNSQGVSKNILGKTNKYRGYKFNRIFNN